MTKILGLIQVRDNSTRLPGKALAEVNSLPVLAHIFARVLASRQLNGVIVSTSESSTDVIGWCRRNGVPFYAGDERDLLSRHLTCLLKNDADAMIRVTGDEIFIDPKFMDDMIGTYREVYEKRPDGLLMSNWYLKREVSEGLDLTIADIRVMTQLDKDRKCPREDWISYAHANDQKYVVWSHTIAAGGEDLHLSIDNHQDLGLARRMMAILGNAKWDYADTLKAYAEATR